MDTSQKNACDGGLFWKSYTIPVPLTPLCRENIPALPERLQLANLAEQFLFFDSVVGQQDRITVFATQQGIKFFG